MDQLDKIPHTLAALVPYILAILLGHFIKYLPSAVAYIVGKGRSKAQAAVENIEVTNEKLGAEVRGQDLQNLLLSGQAHAVMMQSMLQSIEANTRSLQQTQLQRDHFERQAKLWYDRWLVAEAERRLLDKNLEPFITHGDSTSDPLRLRSAPLEEEP